MKLAPHISVIVKKKKTFVKVLPNNIMDDHNSVSNKTTPSFDQELVSTNVSQKTKSKKVKFNKSQDNLSTETIKNTKNSKKNNKKKEESVSGITESSDTIGFKNEDNENVGSKKYKAKEVKEKKNIADKHRSVEEEKTNNQESKKQLFNQV